MKRGSVIGAAAFAAAVFVLGASGAQAQVPLTAKCSAAKLKCSSGKATGLLGCHNKAEGKGVAVDPLCLSKVIGKFDTAAVPPATVGKGCMQKADSKPPCVTTGPADMNLAEAKIDAFVLDIVTELDPGYPAIVLNACSAAKKKCVANKVKGLLGCYGKAAGKGLPVDPLCISKVQTKFGAPGTGCFAKAELKPPCLTVGDAAAIEAKVDAFALKFYNGFTAGFGAETLDFTTTASGGACGVVKTSVGGAFIKNLNIGGLDIGGGGSVVGEGPTPDGATNRFAASCTGPTCTLSATTTAPAPNSADPDCTGVGCNFGTPLPIANAAIPTLTTCVQNTFASAAGGTVDNVTGVASLNVNLTSDIYLTGNLAQPCPKCSVTGSPSSPGTGVCNRGSNLNNACTTTSSTGLTRDCPTGGTDGTHPCTPGGGACIDGSHVGPINVNLSPLTTGTAIAANAGGVFCAGQTSVGCFGSGTCRYYDENGVPFGALPVGGIPSNGRAVSKFCIAATGNGLVDASAALPGPGAVCLAATMQLNP